MKSVTSTHKENEPNQLARKDSNLHMQPALSFLNLDVNYEQLKSYLEQLTGVMNQHAAVIVKVQDEVDKKSYSKSVSDSLNNVAENCSLFDNELLKIAQGLVQKPRMEKTANEIEGNSNKLCNKMNLLVGACTFLFQKMKEHESLLKKHDETIPKLTEKDKAKEKSRKMKKKLEKDANDIKELIERKVSDAEKRLTTQIANFEEGLRQTERKTIWKIEDCQTLLNKRTNNEYVDTVAFNLEEKLMKEITTLKEVGVFGVQDELNRIKEDLFNQIKTDIDNETTEKIKNLKKNLADNIINDKINAKAVSLEKFEETKKMLTDKNQDLFNRIRDFESKSDPSALFETHIQAIRSINEKISALERSLSKRVNEISEKKDNQIQEFIQNNEQIDPHKICALEADIRRAQQEVAEHRDSIKSIQLDLRHKFEKLDSSLIDTLSGGFREQATSKRKSTDKIDKDKLKEALKEIGPQSSADEEVLKKLQRETMEALKKTESVSDLEKRVTRLLKDLDVNNLVKQVKLKADSDEVKRESSILDTKINNFGEQLAFVRKDIESLLNIYRKLSSSMQNVQTEQAGTFLSTKKVVPYHCLSCSGPQGGRGTDGKMYKTDFNIVQTTIINNNENMLFDENKNTHRMGGSLPYSPINGGFPPKKFKLDSSAVQRKSQGAEIRKYLRPGSAKK